MLGSPVSIFRAFCIAGQSQQQKQQQKQCVQTQSPPRPPITSFSLDLREGRAVCGLLRSPGNRDVVNLGWENGDGKGT